MFIVVFYVFFLRDHVVLPAHPRVYPQPECLQSAKAGPYLPAPEGWKAELG